MENIKFLADQVVSGSYNIDDDDVNESVLGDYCAVSNRINSNRFMSGHDYGRFIGNFGKHKRSTIISCSSEDDINLYGSTTASVNSASLERLSVFYRTIPSHRVSTITPIDYCKPTLTIAGSKKSVGYPICYRHWGLTKRKKHLKTFPGASRYLGEWNSLGIAGHGLYKYPHGVIYEGHFNDNGEFHGAGTLIYPNGQKLQAIWNNGRMTDDASYRYADGTCKEDEDFKKDANVADRRFPLEVIHGFGSPGQENITNKSPAKELPPDCFDIGDGIYNARQHYTSISFEKEQDKHVNISQSEDEEKFRQLDDIELDEETENFLDSIELKMSDCFMIHNNMLKIPQTETETWIYDACRREEDIPTGYRPDLYEIFMKGTKRELEEISQENLNCFTRVDECPIIEYPQSSPSKMFTVQYNKMMSGRRRTLPSPDERLSTKKLSIKQKQLKTDNNLHGDESINKKDIASLSDVATMDKIKTILLRRKKLDSSGRSIHTKFESSKKKGDFQRATKEKLITKEEKKKLAQVISPSILKKLKMSKKELELDSKTSLSDKRCAKDSKEHWRVLDGQHSAEQADIISAEKFKRIRDERRRQLDETKISQKKFSTFRRTTDQLQHMFMDNTESFKHPEHGLLSHKSKPHVTSIVKFDQISRRKTIESEDCSMISTFSKILQI